MNDISERAFFFDPHTWDGPKELVVAAEKYSYWTKLLEHTQRPRGDGYLFFFDGFAQGRLPLFFPKSRRVAVLKESPLDTRAIDTRVLEKRFHLVLTHREDLLKRGVPFRRLDFSSNWLTRDPARQEQRKSKLVSFVANITHQSELAGYAFRRAAYRRLRTSPVIDFFGKGINEFRFKSESLDHYCFSIAMENARENYYYSEKLIDCIMSRTIPIYWGCPAISEIFDARGMLVFETLEELEQIVGALSFEKYDAMLEYAKKNQNICEDRLLSSFFGYLTRMMVETERVLKYPTRRLLKAEVGRVMAAGRLLVESLST